MKNKYSHLIGKWVTSGDWSEDSACRVTEIDSETVHYDQSIYDNDFRIESSGWERYETLIELTLIQARTMLTSFSEKAKFTNANGGLEDFHDDAGHVDNDFINLYDANKLDAISSVNKDDTPSETNLPKIQKSLI